MKKSNQTANNLTKNGSARVSVVVTVHNYARYLEQCLQSIAKQTLQPLEVIIVDDASDDNPEKFARKFLDRYDYFSFYRKEFADTQKARNFGCGLAKGEFLLNLDADDYMREDALEKLTARMLSDDDLALVYSGVNNFGEEEAIKRLDLPPKKLPPKYNYQLLQKDNYIYICSLIRKEWFQGFDEDIRRLQDWEAWLNLLKHRKAARVEDYLFYVRIHSLNKTMTKSYFLERVKVMHKHGILVPGELRKKGLLDKLFSRKYAVMVFPQQNGLVGLQPDQVWEIKDGGDLDESLEELKKRVVRADDLDYLLLVNSDRTEKENMTPEKLLINNDYLLRLKDQNRFRELSDIDSLIFSRGGLYKLFNL